ncbi:myeloid-derived growth factor homolog [Oscarella lobularis]|uniref:myeloid-derived growth factor homolog n=1 Tax=Oscarella lobularis TaxID=121494 RepID=UPI0033133ED6
MLRMLRLFLVCALLSVVLSSKEIVQPFNVQPNGQVSHFDVALGKVKCLFSWAAVGGTNEDWQMSLTKENGYTCVVERPEKTSYLFFQNFAASILGAELKSVEIFDSLGNVLASENFDIDFSDGSVKSIEGKFKNSLGRVVLHAKKSKKKKKPDKEL